MVLLLALSFSMQEYAVQNIFFFLKPERLERESYVKPQQKSFFKGFSKNTDWQNILHPVKL